MPSLKRKAFEREDSSSSDYSDYERYGHPSKRLRCGILESGLAQLSLGVAAQSPIVTEPPLSYTSPLDTLSHNQRSVTQGASNTASSSFASGGIAWDGTTYDPTQADPQHTQPVVLPGSVEEPTSPEISTVQEDPPDVTMKSRSWYEPEKDREYFSHVPATPHVRSTSSPGIVVVDLDDSDVEDSTDDSSPQITVNSALLRQISGKSEPLLTSQKDNGSSMALVLFKPLPIPTREVQEEDSDGQPPNTRFDTSEGGPIDVDVDLVDTAETESSAMDVDDAMDIE